LQAWIAERLETCEKVTLDWFAGLRGGRAAKWVARFLEYRVYPRTSFTIRKARDEVRFNHSVLEVHDLRKSPVRAGHRRDVRRDRGRQEVPGAEGPGRISGRMGPSIQ